MMSDRAKHLWAWFFGVFAPPILFILDPLMYRVVIRADIGSEEYGVLAAHWAWVVSRVPWKLGVPPSEACCMSLRSHAASPFFF